MLTGQVLLLRLTGVEMQVAVENGAGEQADNVEECHCPSNYMGHSCEVLLFTSNLFYQVLHFNKNINPPTVYGRLNRP